MNDKAWIVASAHPSLQGITVLPLCATFHAVTRLGHSSVRSVVLTVLSLAVAAVTLVLARLAVTGGGFPVFLREDNPASFSDSVLTRFLTYNYLYAKYAWLLMVPADLSFDWQMGAIPLVDSISDTRIAYIVVLHIGAAVFTVGTWRATTNIKRIIIISSVWSILTFLPASNIFMRVGFTFADRVLYMPSMGYCLLVALLLELIVRRVTGRALRVVIVAAVVAVLAGYTVKSAIRSTDWYSIERLCHTGIEVNPRCAKCHFILGNMYKGRADHNMAIEHYERVLELWPGHPGTHNNLGTIVEQHGRTDLAEHHYRAALEYNPLHPTAHHNLGNILKAKGQLRESMHHYHEALRVRPDDTNAMTALADAYWMSGMEKEAVSLYELAVKTDSSNNNARIHLAGTLARLGKHKQALEHYRQAATVDPSSADAVIGVVLSLEELGRTEEAKTWNSRLQSMQAVTSDILLQSAEFDERIGQLEQACASYQRSLRLEPGSFVAIVGLERVTLSLKGEAAVEAMYRQEIKHAPNTWQIHAFFGNFLVQHINQDLALLEWNTAIELYEKAGKGNREHKALYTDCLLNTAVMLANSHRATDAVLYAQKALATSPDNPKPHFMLGNLLRESDPQQAEQMYRQAIVLDGNVSLYHGNLAALLHAQRRFNEAEASYKEALRLDPSSSWLAENYARMRQAAGRL